jgi:ubiquinone/menaquinone biosynthesis C-methylase UbiE
MAERPPNFDPIARLYRWLEYLSFGPCLERCRYHYLGELGDRRRALILGDGDGRFTARLLAANPKITAEAIDSSAAMLRLLTQRVARLGPSASDRLQTSQTNALDFAPESPYDLVVTHFFLDCFSEQDVDTLISRSKPHLTPDATWLISEFTIPQRTLARYLSSAIVAFLYWTFGLITGLKIRKLPDYATLLNKAGFELRQSKAHLGGLLRSEVWSSSELLAGPSQRP